MPKVTVKVPKLNGFDKSFKHLATAKVGTLVPLLTDELPAGTKVHLKSAIMAQLPPLATDAFMRVNLKVEAFFCPHRLLYGGFTSWMTKETLRIPTKPNQDLHARLPLLKIKTGEAGPGTLMDYLGMHKLDLSRQEQADVNIFPLLCYHRIFDDWYRSPNVQTPVFTKPLVFGETGQIHPYTLPYITFDDSTPAAFIEYSLDSRFADGVSFGSLRQRNFGFDYFTNALPSPQRGDAKRVSIETGEEGKNPTFTIASLRAANSLQQYEERNELCGPRWQDWLKANYNADLSDGVAQRAIYLGSGEIPVYNKSVLMTAPNSLAGTQETNGNPFAGPISAIGQAAKFGDASASGSLDLVKDFTTNEPGILMVLVSLVPVVTYGNGVNRMFFRFNADDAQTDMATPILQNVGNQPIYAGELNGYLLDKTVFGYTDRYADFKYKCDELSGLVRDGQSLQAFALQRNVVGNPEISDEFLQIPTNYMDQVTVVEGWLSQFGYWCDAFFDYKVAMPLDSYSLPSLQDPAYEHGQDVTIDTNGKQIR